jgi:hypothetical protein
MALPPRLRLLAGQVFILLFIAIGMGIDAKTLEEVLEWIETLGDQRGLSQKEKEVASVIARRRLSDEPDTLPKQAARDAVKEAPAQT